MAWGYSSSVAPLAPPPHYVELAIHSSRGRHLTWLSTVHQQLALLLIGRFIKITQDQEEITEFCWTHLRRIKCMADGYNIINSQTVSHVQKKMSVENDLTVENSPVIWIWNGEKDQVIQQKDQQLEALRNTLSVLTENYLMAISRRYAIVHVPYGDLQEVCYCAWHFWWSAGGMLYSCYCVYTKYFLMSVQHMWSDLCCPTLGGIQEATLIRVPAGLE